MSDGSQKKKCDGGGGFCCKNFIVIFISITAIQDFTRTAAIGVQGHFSFFLSRARFSIIGISLIGVNRDSLIIFSCRLTCGVIHSILYSHALRARVTVAAGGLLLGSLLLLPGLRFQFLPFIPAIPMAWPVRTCDSHNLYC